MKHSKKRSWNLFILRKCVKVQQMLQNVEGKNFKKIIYKSVSQLKTSFTMP